MHHLLECCQNSSWCLHISQCYLTCFMSFVAKSGATPVFTSHLFDFGWYHKRKSSFLPFAQHVLPVNLCIFFWFFFKQGNIESLNGLSQKAL